MLSKTTIGTGKEDEYIAPGSTYSTSTSSFLNNIWGNALTVGFDTYAGKCSGSTDKNTKKHLREYAMLAASQKAGLDIVKNAQKLSVKEKAALRQGFGTPTTKCKLPSGDIFDTRCISGRNRHAINNKLATRENTNFHPGMKTNLKIDFTNQSEEYKTFIEVQPAKKEKESSVKIEICSSNDSDIIEVIESPKKKQAFSYVEQMHNRVMTRARRDLSRSIEAQMKNDNDKKRKITKTMKETVKKLEQSELDKKHLNTIRNVTENGMKLNCKQPLSSPEVLDRIKLYHDIE